MILRKKSDSRFVTPDNFSAVHERPIVAACFSQVRLRNRGRVREQRVHQSGLAGAVPAHQRDFFSADYTRRETGNYFGIAVRLAKTFDFKNMFARGPLLLELQVRALNIRSRQFSDLQALDFLPSGLHLTGAGSGGEAGDELVQLVDFLLALSVLRFDLRANLCLRNHHVVISAGVSNDGLVIDVGDVGANAVEEMTVV